MAGCLRQGENEKLSQLSSLACHGSRGPNALPLTAAERISGADFHLLLCRQVSVLVAGRMGTCCGKRGKDASAEGREGC